MSIKASCVKHLKNMFTDQRDTAVQILHIIATSYERVNSFKFWSWIKRYQYHRDCNSAYQWASLEKDFKLRLRPEENTFKFTVAYRSRDSIHVHTYCYCIYIYKHVCMQENAHSIIQEPQKEVKRKVVFQPSGHRVNRYHLHRIDQQTVA